jgi:hypothetical protein
MFQEGILKKKGSVLSYFITLFIFMNYERLIELRLPNFTRVVHSKERVTRLALFQR